MNIDEKLSKVFGIEPMPQPTETAMTEVLDAVPSDGRDKKVDSDFEETRRNLHDLLRQGQEALDAALEVAKQSEHPRAFEVVGQLMKNLSDINHQLLDLHTKHQTLTGSKGKAQQQSVTNNTVFVGSTTELSKMVESMRKGTS